MKEVKKKKPGKREAARDLMRECNARVHRAATVGPLKPWSGVGCNICNGKHDAIHLHYDKIETSDDGNAISVRFTWLCPKDKRGIAMKSLWKLLQSGVTRIERMPDPPGTEEARQFWLKHVERQKKKTA